LADDRHPPDGQNHPNINGAGKTGIGIFVILPNHYDMSFIFADF
jgi:hypothetical protein